MACALALLMALGCAVPADAADIAERRRVLFLWDSTIAPRFREALSFTMIEKPLNWLGLLAEPVDLSRELPDPATLGDVRGVIVWLQSDGVRDPDRLVAYLNRLLDAGLRYVHMGEIAFYNGAEGTQAAPAEAVSRLFERIGMSPRGGYVRLPFDAEVVRKDPAYVEFERPFSDVIPPYTVWRPSDARVRSHLILRSDRSGGAHSHLVMTGPGGGMAAAGFIHYYSPELQRAQWKLDPFRFLAEALGVEGVPVPDVTTRVGRRIYFSHIDGDGWRNVTLIDPWRKMRKLSSAVILDAILRRYPDMPVTVAPIVADIHPDWCGTSESRKIASDMFALPNVEIGNHTWTHPLDWGFFDTPDAAEREAAYAHVYPGCRDEPAVWSQVVNRVGMRLGIGQAVSQTGEKGYGTAAGYRLPRAFALKPFDPELEVVKSTEYINTLAPPGKSVRLIQWSGNTRPYERMLRDARRVGIRNMNGGDSRYDDEFPSVGYVSPIGRKVGAERQIYAAASNENTYTDLWTDRYFGYRKLVTTFERTETPRRLLPLNVYYHVYSGEKETSLEALVRNLEYVRRQETVALFASDYVAIAEGFYGARIVKTGDGRWRIEKRGELQTVRIDAADPRAHVDIARARGVLGYRHINGSLYVALDPDEEAPEFSLGTSAPQRPTLVQSAWDIRTLVPFDDDLSAGFTAQGFGKGDMTWRVRPGRDYAVAAGNAPAVIVRSDGEGMLRLDLPDVGNRPTTVRIERTVR